MVRPLRLEYAGARYHVMNRGNYRRDVFETAGAAMAFETTLGEACVQHAWVLHAYIVMRNHFHLALETPRANLVEGMHWLESTYAVRFNRYRGEHGHFFQGRYKALIIEDATYLRRVIDYIHLNPVRAGLIEPANLVMFRPSSLPRLIHQPRPAWLTATALLEQAGLSDTAEGWSDYLAWLALEATRPAQVGHEFSSGWAIGSPEWRSTVARRHKELARQQGVTAAELRDFKHAAWTAEFESAFKEIGRTELDLRREPKGAAWKIALARRLRERAAVPHAWIAESLHMGTASSVRAHVCRAKPINN